MKTLYIVRHGKSAWDTPGLEDHQRTLLEKGIKRTRWVGGYLSNAGVVPDLIISSHAKRALETAKIIGNILNYPEERIQISESIYLGNVDDVFQLLFELNHTIGSVMLFGHNPTFTYLANHFLSDKMDNLSTSGVVCIEFETDKWEELFIAQNTVKFVITPRMLREEKF